MNFVTWDPVARKGWVCCRVLGVLARHCEAHREAWHDFLEETYPLSPEARKRVEPVMRGSRRRVQRAYARWHHFYMSDRLVYPEL